MDDGFHWQSELLKKESKENMQFYLEQASTREIKSKWENTQTPNT